MDLAVKILIKLLKTEPSLVDALVRICNRSVTFYAGTDLHVQFYVAYICRNPFNNACNTGSRTSWTNYPGDPHTRISVISKFSELGGFSIIRDMLRRPDAPWLGADKLTVLVVALNDIDTGFTADVSGEIVDEVMRQLMDLSEERVKKESTDSLSALIRSLLPRRNKERLMAFYDFWLSHTLKMMNCASIVLKLFAWDQLHEVIREAVATRPPPRRYLVRNAGTEEVNGIYTATFDYGDVPSYEKLPSEEGGHLFTLFRCTMRSKQKWWFISVADIEKPGTDRDVDYYQHKSHIDQDMEPPTLGWSLATGSRSPSVEPPPVLVRLEAIEGEDGQPLPCLMDTLLKWTRDEHLLEKVFGQSVHREIVSRSKNLLVLLGETDRLSAADIEMVWRVGAQTGTEDTQEVFSLLASVSLHLSDTCFDALDKLARDSLRSGNPDSIHRVVELVEGMNEEGAKYVRSLSAHAKGKIMGLVWTLYNTPGVESNKSYSSVEEMLSLCLRYYRNGDQVLTYLRECSDVLLNFKSSDGVVDEKRISRIIRTLTFLLNQHADPGLEEVLSESGFYAVLLAELERYIALHVEGRDASAQVITEVANRLTLLRSAYGLSSRIKMNSDELDDLWRLLSTPPVREQLFLFFRNAGVKQGHMESVYSITECLHVFRAMLCSRDLDWSECGEEAFLCFSVYFSGLSNRSEFDDETREAAVNTLWNITLRLPSAPSAAEAIALLLKASADMELYEPDTTSPLLSRIFDELRAAEATCATAGELSPSLKVTITRCTDLLNNIISRATQALSTGKSSGSLFTPHAVRGNIFRIKVLVRYRVLSHPSHHTNVYNRRQSADSSSSKVAIVELHPMHSLHVLKQKINAVACTLQMRVNVDLDSTVLLGDTYPISHFGITDGSELVATLTRQTTVSSVYDDDDYNDVYYSNVATRYDGSVELSMKRLAAVSAEENFECLLNLIDTLDRQDMSGVTRGLWSLLMVVPTQSGLLDRIQGLFESTDEQWASVLKGCKSRAAATYTLQIVDFLLQPAPEMAESDIGETDRKAHFIQAGGFGAVLEFFVCTGGDGRNEKLSLAVALHILHYCLFDIHSGQASPDLICQVQESSGAVLEKLLAVAYNAALADESGIVQNALGMITALLQAPSIASQLTSNPKAKNLLTAVLRSASKTVRDMAAEFAVQVGKSQPIVMQWLLVELENTAPSEINAYELFRAFCMLVEQVGEFGGEVDLFAICDSVSRKLLQFKAAVVCRPAHSDRSVLLGCLELLRCLIKIDGAAVSRTDLGQELIDTFVTDFLFTMPGHTGADCSPVCDTPDTRRAAFAVLSAFVKLSPEYLVKTVDQLQRLTRSSAAQMKNTWGLQVSHDVRRPNIQFSGLKNQGCTCYLNSLIQQLFMSRSFRDVVMRTPIRNSLRSTLWHLSDDELVGKEFLFEWSSGEWRMGRITAYSSGLSQHTVQYKGLDGTTEDVVSFNVHCGRPHKETGRVKPVPQPGSVVLSDRELSAVVVLEQLQRTFCFMEKSKKRYFDPRPFIESCKSLNLNFNMYHQNDASEFCDQLLDRLETAMKGKCTQTDMWKEMMQRVFGGKMLYQKIPKECDKFTIDRRDCGHWQSTRTETFLKAELLIRGKESIEEGLAQVIEGELMDGDNKIMCDTCNQKKDTVRRTCFGKLPNMLILHLKRFDLDFTTFETVKLNNRVTFPTNMSMFQYTKEGIEAQEKAAAEADGPVVDREEKEEDARTGTQIEAEKAKEVDLADYEYELQGVLVHSGIAQGGHYYSFIRDPEHPDNWFLFDDDEVSPFNPDNIPSQCFGGSYQTSLQGMSSMIEEDRSSNALMLFYNKVREGAVLDDDDDDKNGDKADEEGTEPMTSEVLEECSNGYRAFDREVGESNLRHALANYLVDPSLHGFVRALIRSMYEPNDDLDSPPASPGAASIDTGVVPAAETVMSTVKFGTQFLLDVILHCRERSGTKQWCTELRNVFETYPETAKWFIKYILGKNCAVLQEYVLRCADALSRSTFVQLIGHAVSALCSKDWPVDCLLEYSQSSVEDILRAMKENPTLLEPLLVLLINQVMKLLPEATSHLPTCDELFGLIRELAKFPPLCSYMLHMDAVAQICFFIIPEKVPPAVEEMFAAASPRFIGADSKPFHSVLFEVIAALLGVPQSQKVHLLNEKANLWEPELTEDAARALTAIFKECAHYGGMDSRDILTYMDRVHASDETSPKVSALQVRSILDRYDTHTDGRLSLSGFLRYYADTALYQSKTVWKVGEDYTHALPVCFSTNSLFLDSISKPFISRMT